MTVQGRIRTVGAVNTIFYTRLRWSVGERDYSCRKNLSLGVLLLTVRAGEGLLLTVRAPVMRKQRLGTVTDPSANP